MNKNALSYSRQLFNNLNNQMNSLKRIYLNQDKEDFLSKNCFNRLFHNYTFKSIHSLIEKFFSGDLSPNTMLILKSSLNNNYLTSGIFSKSYFNFIEKEYSLEHKLNIEFNIPIKNSTLTEEKEYNFYLLKRNIEQEKRYIKSYSVLSKYLIRAIDSEYNKLTQK